MAGGGRRAGGADQRHDGACWGAENVLYLDLDVCMCVCTGARTCVHACTGARVCVRACTHRCARACMQAHAQIQQVVAHDLCDLRQVCHSSINHFFNNSFVITSSVGESYSLFQSRHCQSQRTIHTLGSDVKEHEVGIRFVLRPRRLSSGHHSSPVNEKLGEESEE